MEKSPLRDREEAPLPYAELEQEFGTRRSRLDRVETVPTTMDEVNRTGEEITITKNGTPVSVLRAYRTIPKTLFGLHKGKTQSKDDLIAPLDIDWDASNADS